MFKLRYYFDKIFIAGLTGMAHGLFSTLIIGTILIQIGSFLGNMYGTYLITIGKIASMLTGAGIGVGLANRFKSQTFVLISSASAGMIGAYAKYIINGNLLSNGSVIYSNPGDPLSAFIAAFFAIECANLVVGKTKLDILITPSVGILSGTLVAIFINPYISSFLNNIGNTINTATKYNPLFMSISVSVIMGIILTLPISSAALSIILNLSGFAGGAASIGCACHMVGFAVTSFKDNGIGGFFTQILGTSMVQMPNIIKKPLIIIPQILSSAVIAPIAILIFKMTNNSTGAGMGTSGLVGQIMTYKDMAKSPFDYKLILIIILLHFIFPGILSLFFYKILYSLKLIKAGDMKLSS